MVWMDRTGLWIEGAEGDQSRPRVRGGKARAEGGSIADRPSSGRVSRLLPALGGSPPRASRSERVATQCTGGRCVAQPPASEAPRYSRLRRAMLATEIALGHAAS